MSRTFIRQDDQIAASNTSSGGYSDATAPSLANYQTSPNTILDDLNNLRSVAHYLKNVQTSNWYTAQTAPVTLEAGILRGVDNLNNALHLIEKKRVLRDVYLLVDITVPSSVQATGTFTSAGVFSDGETVTIGTQTYTFKSPFVDAANNIDASGTTAQTHENLRRAINGDGVAGTNYGTGTAVNTNVTATDTATSNVLTAILGGTAGNLVATTETCANASFGAATLTGGAGDVNILTAPQLPTNTTAAVGVVTTLGTVVASHTGTFGNISLDEVVGSNAVNPKNLLLLVDGATRDPILSGGRVIYGLLQTESGIVDGDTITASTPDRAQISYVRINTAGDDLEYCPAVDIAGKVINYSYRERVRLEGLSEQDFLRGAVVDVPAASAVDRQDVYDNQATTPVELTTNATLDLNSAGIYWEIRDLANATLFRITEGSGGGTTTLQIATDVDTFDVNAVVNDFNTGIRANTGGTRPIRVGSTDGVIETTAGDLGLTAFAEFAFVDGNKSGSTYAGQLKLSDTSLEWSNYETAFGEVSLLNAIYQAANTNLHSKVWAIATADVAADTDVSGPANDNNLDTNLGDLSGGDFLQDYDLYLNGVLLRPGANAAANHDYYPGTSLANGQLKFEFNIKGTGSKPDQFTLIKWV